MSYQPDNTHFHIYENRPTFTIDLDPYTVYKPFNSLTIKFPITSKDVHKSTANVYIYTKQVFLTYVLHRVNTSYYLYLFFLLKKLYMFFLKTLKKDFASFVPRGKYSRTFASLVLVVFGAATEANGQTEKYTKFYYTDGTVSSEGLMRNGQPDGYWKTYYPDGGLKTEGNRKEFQLDSTWKFYRSDSTLEKTIDYKNNEKNGWERIFSDDEVLKEEFTFENSVKNGISNYYYPTGEKSKTVTFVQNKEEGKAFEYDKDGRVITLLTYKNGFIYASEKINRFNSEGRKTGVWRELYPTGVTKEEGNWTNGLKNGIFKLYKKNGDLDRLEKYEDGIKIEGDEQTMILEVRQQFYESGNVKERGSYKEGKKQGTFRFYDENGNETGAALYVEDQKIGEGKIDSTGQRQGDWKLYYPSGELRAQGAYVNGLKEGDWMFFFSNGKQEQKGAYKVDLPVGAWKWYYTSGALHRDELYRKGKEDGRAIEYDSTGKVINEGDYVDGLKNGAWLLTVNDHTESGNYVDGEKDGEWVWTYQNGQKAFEGSFQLGVPIEKHKYWYANGNVKSKGAYEGGELNGTWSYYAETGLLELEVMYEAGIATKINGKKIKLPQEKEEN
jgi:antitoxin component YwqK of YwqJK toxin-antitoxin module